MRSTIEMAREAGCDEIHVAKILTGVHLNSHALERLVELARADEREACAKVCDEVDKESQSQWPRRLATMIRARGETK
jgi:hypothetical protein